MNALPTRPLAELLAEYPFLNDLLASLGLPAPAYQLTLSDWLDRLPDETFFDAGMERTQLIDYIARSIVEMQTMATMPADRVTSLTLIGGQDKSGRPENVELTLHPGDIVCIVGPTGSGKSRLLGDIECLAQGDTPTGRRILINGQVPDESRRYRLDRKLVAQLSQNMNFVVDLSVRELIGMHARCRQVAQPEALTDEVIACANALAGEPFSPDTSVTQLSGGQTRALMIADVALLSASPVVLIDEIENAGVDRQRALEWLVKGDKIVLISTHDPLLALRGDRRIVVRHGGIADILATDERERASLARIEAMDRELAALRDRLRRGERIDDPPEWTP